MGFLNRRVLRDSVSETWVKQVGQALTKKFKISVRKGKGWSADVDKGILTYGPEIHLLNHNQALGILCHEIGHLRYTENPKENSIAKEFPMLTHQGVNMLEDHRIESLMGKAFPGAQEAIALMREHMLKKAEDNLVDYGERLRDDFDKVTDYCLENGIKPFSSIGELQQIRSKSPKDLNETEKQRREIAMAWDHGGKNQMPMVTQILLSASLMHYGRLPEGYPDPEINAVAKRVQVKMAQAKVEEMKNTEEVSDFFQKEIYPEMSTYFTEVEERKVPNSPGRAGTELSEKERRQYNAPTKGEEIRAQVEEFAKENLGDDFSFSRGNGREDAQNFTYKVTKALVQAEIGGSTTKLKRILKDAMFDRYAGRFLSGRLNERKLYKHRMGDMRLFQRKVAQNNRDFAFVLAVDVSSSMCRSSRMVNAQKATVLLNEVLSECKVPVGIYGFGEDISTAKRLGEETNERQIEQVLKRMERDTQIGMGVRTGAKALESFDRRNKVLITITDGNVRSSDCREIKELQEKYRQVQFYGIGVQCTINHIFPEDNTFNLKNTEELMPTLLGILRRHIRN